MMRRSPSPFRQIVGAFLVLASLVAWSVPAVSDEVVPGAPSDEQAFLRVRPLPEGLDKVEPIPGAVNVRFIACEAQWPDGYKANRDKIGSAEFRAKSDVYAYLRALQAFESRDCGCSGKVADWEDVDAIYASFGEVSDGALAKFSADFAGKADRLVSAVETMCGGKF